MYNIPLFANAIIKLLQYGGILMDIDSLMDLDLKICNLKDMLLSDVDMPEDVTEYYLDKLNALEVQRSMINGL